MSADRGHERQRSARMEAEVRLGMRSEEERLQTFHNWPSDAAVSPEELARAGFHYLGYGDTVQCFCCEGILRHWVDGDTPRGEHERHFPTCGLMRGRDVGNVPRGSSDSVDGQLLSQLQRLTMDEQGLTGQAAYSEMETEDNRRSTFHNWPTGAAVQPDTLARAGFFYTGHGDNVKCFFCDGGLRNWEPGDDPWQEHAKWFPQCEYLLQSRGQEYVRNVQQSFFNMNGRGGGSLSSAAGNITPVRSDLSPEEQLRQLQEERTCKVSMDKLVSMVFIPCGHLVACSDCAASLRHCPICRAVIRGSVRAFMS
uniref:RING-type E3 ubiquitin transferase n=1 Tax=Danio rerio TaxID=7955 RepID=A5PLG7_DANRE|nr:baculoviral IAP repeat-containing protein 7 [Danio rerio]AAI42897.1 Zgc:165605 protein [Danio rerio]|eukprot:NP_001092238.1 baculoviral IAP repeat containing 7 [Danio rerio]